MSNEEASKAAEDSKFGAITHHKVREVDFLHLTGGLRGRRVEGGWNIGPLANAAGPEDEIGTIPDEQVSRVVSAISLTLFGVDEIVIQQEELPLRIWRPIVGLPSNIPPPADSWGSIAHNANRAGEREYADLSQYVSICLRASDIRLRDLSDGYGAQLLAAVRRGQKVGELWDNIATADIHLAIHSLVSEMSAARDHLARIVGLHIGAPTSKDSLARLLKWIEAASRHHLLEVPIVERLFRGWRGDSGDRWLFELSEYRNSYLHRRPLGAQGINSALRLTVQQSPWGEIRRLEMPIPVDEAELKTVDGLERFVLLHRNMVRMAADLAEMALFPSTPLTITEADIVEN